MISALLFAATLAPMIEVVPNSVQKVSQVTGERDNQLNAPAKNRTITRFGLAGTDLGASFEHDGKLVFLFGDTHPAGPHTPDRPVDGDPIAFSTDTDGDKGLNLDFVTAPDGKYKALTVDNVALGAFCVPNGGFSYNGALHAFFTTDIETTPLGVSMGRSVLIRSQDAKEWQLLGTLSTDKFINVSPVEVDATKVEGLPTREGRGLLLWASGREYRRTNLHLAYMPLDGSLGDRTKIRYWAGEGRWSQNEVDARPLFHHPMVGEIDVKWCEPLKRWVMLYNIEQPSCVVMRTAEGPLGPWSNASVLFAESRDGFGKFIYQAGNGQATRLSDPNRLGTTGGAYGPYMIPRFFRKEGNEAVIYFLLSTWNPYNVVLMRARLRT